MLSITVQQSLPVGRVVVAGELDTETAPQLITCIESEVELGRSRLAVDLQALTFCDSRGLVALLQASDRCRRAGGSLAVVGATGSVARVFAITGVDEVLSRGRYLHNDPTQRRRSWTRAG
ncbi:MAG TPA: STAS domain-containing protein [Micromonosporaceae bacterium]|nr:STAS domain-containing protein [Micromonosporaceae bacterium]